MKTFITLYILILTISINSQDISSTNTKFEKWQQPGYYRGYNVLYESPKTLQDFIDFKNYGGNLFQIGTKGFMGEDAPYAVQQAHIDGTDMLVNYCRQAGIHYVIAVRSGPGAYDTYLESSGQSGESRIWNSNNTSEQAQYANMLKMIVQRYSADSLFAGLTIMVEPRPKVRQIPANTSALYKRFLETVFNIHMDRVYNFFISQVRTVDSKLPLIVENFAYSTPELFPPYDVNDPYVVYSYHNYQPKEYTNAQAPFTVNYPGYYWNLTTLSQQTYNAEFIRGTILSKVRSYQLSSGRPIFMGEFGMFLPQNGGQNYINDVLSACKDYGWHVSLWDWRRRSGQNWDIEIFQGDNHAHWNAVLSNFHAPPVPGAISPVSGSNITTSNPVFRWDSLTSFTSYDFMLRDSSSNPVLVVKDINLARLTYTGTPLRPGMRYNWQIRSKNPGGKTENWSEWSSVYYFTAGSLTGINNNEIPGEFKLSQNYPNPFNPSSVISYEISKASFVRLKVYDLLGREVSSLVNEQKSPGKYSVTFSATALSSGIYFYRLDAVNSDGSVSFTDIKRMMLIK